MRKLSFQQYMDELKTSFKNINESFSKNDVFGGGNSGTVLGAVRSQGTIPGDDDIDMTMFNDDFIKNKDMIKKIADEYNFDLADPVTTKALDVARLFSKEFILVEGNGQTFLTKIFIDIMLALPIKKESKIRSYGGVVVNQYSVIYRRFYKIMPKRALIKGKIRKLGFFNNLGVALGKMFSFLFMFGIPYGYQKKLIKKTSKDATTYQMFSGASTYGTYFKKGSDNFVEVKFDDTMIYINSDYKEMLEYKYGDGNKLPPEEERIPKHFPITIYTGKEKYEINPYIII